MTKLVLENTVIAEAAKRAAAVAPSARGLAWDKAHGVVLYVQPGSDYPLIMCSTNLLVFYSEWISATESEGSPAVWRLPSAMISTILGGLPIGTGKEVTLEDHDSVLKVTSGRMRASLNIQSTEGYPTWEPFSTEGLTTIEEFGAKLKSVEYCASKDRTRVTSGVHLDGEFAMATDTLRIARVPCEVDLGQGGQAITFPAGILDGVVKDAAPVQLGTDGNQILLMPDDYTQIRTATLGTEFPDVAVLAREEYEYSVRLHREQLVDLLRRCAAVDADNRIPMVRLYVGRGEIAAYVENDKGRLGDSIEVPGYCDHARIERFVNPTYFLDAVRGAGREMVTVAYNAGKNGAPGTRKLKFYDDAGYEAWVSLITRPLTANDA